MKIIGHRGAKGLAPENTLAALAKGMEHRADEIEIDIRLTRDEIPVLHHDGSIEINDQKLIILAYTLAELRQYKPDLATLEEALQFVDSKTTLLIEVKPAEPVEPIVAILRQYLEGGYHLNKLLLASKSQSTLRQLHRELPDIQKIVIESWSGVRAVYRARQVDTKRLSMRSWWLWSGFLKSMHRRGYMVAPYTMNDPARVRKWQPYLYGVITDYPDRFQK